MLRVSHEYSLDQLEYIGMKSIDSGELGLVHMGRHASLSQSPSPTVLGVLERERRLIGWGKDRKMAPNAAGAGDKFPSRWAQ